MRRFSFIGNKVPAGLRGILPVRKMFNRKINSIIGNGAGLFTSGGPIIEFADGYYTGPSATSVDYGGVWTDFGAGVAPIVTIDGKEYIQIEPASENIFTGARELDHGDWTRYRVTCSGADIDALDGPDGNPTADNLKEVALDSYHYMGQSKTPDGTSMYCLSAYAKGGLSRDWSRLQINPQGFTAQQVRYFDHTNGVGGTGSPPTSGIEGAANSWYREFISAQSAATAATLIVMLPAPADGIITYLGETDKGCRFWNAQFEISAYPSSPVNSGATVTTRAANSIYWASADVPAVLRGAVTFRWIPYWGSDYLPDITLAEWDESGASNNIRVWYDDTDNKIYVTDETGSSTLVSSDALTITRLDVIDITLDPSAGSITVAGATAGNGTNVSTSWSTSAGNFYLGCNESAGEQCKGLISLPYEA